MSMGKFGFESREITLLSLLNRFIIIHIDLLTETNRGSIERSSFAIQYFQRVLQYL